MGTWGSSTDRGRLSIGKAERLTGALARARRTGFGPGALQFYALALGDGDTFPFAVGISGSTISQFPMSFPGSIIAMTVISQAAYSGAAGANYIDFEPYIDGVASGFTMRLAGGASSVTATQQKNVTGSVFASGSLVQLKAVNHTGTPLPVNKQHIGIVWVSYT